MWLIRLVDQSAKLLQPNDLTTRTTTLKCNTFINSQQELRAPLNLGNDDFPRMRYYTSIHCVYGFATFNSSFCIFIMQLARELEGRPGLDYYIDMTP